MEEEKSKKSRVQDEKVPFYKLFSFADRNDVVLMTVGTISAVANGLTQPLLTLLFGQIVNAFGSFEIFKEVSKVSCWVVTGERQSTRIRSLYLKTILQQEIGFFDTETSTGEVIGRMSGDTILIQDAMGEKVGKFIQLIATFFGGFVVAFIRGWELTLILMVCIPLIVAVGAIAALTMSKMVGSGQAAYAEAGNVVDQAVGGIRTVVAFTGEKQAIDKYNRKLEIAYKSTVKQGLISGLGMGVMLFVTFSSYGFAVWYGAKLMVEKGYDGGQVVNVIFSVLAGGMSLGQTSPCLNAFASGQAATFKMFKTIKRNPKIDAYDPTGMVLEEIQGDIELKDVYFHYPARPEVQIFAGFSLFIPSGTTVALVGQSGSGKSTVISLIERFYDPEAGQVLIDNNDLKKLKLKWIRSKIGLVSQEPTLFATTIRENIAYGKENATDHEIRTAIELANASKFIRNIPEGLDAMVGEKGTQLSGGQKQRIAIARAILKNPKILLLDEATSALDAESEHIVQDALVNLMANRTTVVVAHRLTTIRTANMVAVVHEGKIIEKGTHEEMIQDPEGAYSQLVRLQEGSNEESERNETSFESDHMQVGQTSSRRLSSRRMSRHSSRSRLNDERHDSSSNENRAALKRKKVSLRRLASLNKAEIPVLLLGSVAAMVHGTMYPIFGYLLSSSINMFFEPPDELKKDARFWSIIYVLLGLVNLVSVPIQNYLFGIAGGRLIKRIRSMTFDKVLHQEISWFDNTANSSGAIGSRLSTDASTVKSLVGDALALIVETITNVAAGLIIAFVANWKLAFIVLFVSPVIVFQGYLQTKLLSKFSADAKEKYEEAGQVANEAVSSIRTVASFCAEKKLMNLYETKCKGAKNEGVRLGLVNGLGYGFSFFVLYCINALTFYAGSYMIEHEEATFKEFFNVFFALTVTAVGVSHTSALAPDTTKAKDSASSIFDILDSKPKIDSSSDQGTTLANVKGDIEFKHVSFRYPTRPDIQIFHDLCLVIPSGKTVALVGESGSGKSTVISMVLRFYDPDLGKILLDNVEIQSFKLSWLRQQMGLVSQEPVLFNETIRSNIVYGKTGGFTEEDITNAAKAANAHNFISSLPEGYETSVGERGVQLSGGQKQRIAIARAILKDPKILLLDEATSALDAESERVVQDALERVMVNRTTVVVAHRLGTVKNADVIAVVKNGVIVEKGRHERLMKISGGAYASLVALHMSSN
ncbi:hypothetical protein EUTSA_v10024241mg [Eutrema salsugineum]|uniref:ABC transporter B family member 9 n=1 Tax=Eutrema salsugineum TaxID=72664 RepID=V4MKI6_EUTSA|nr:hypothetical protein EUTSA_v10024241mg [Eutrema salsugineum]